MEEMTPEQEEKHKAFVKARGRHYSNEGQSIASLGPVSQDRSGGSRADVSVSFVHVIRSGEAMKRAQALLAQEDEEMEGVEVENGMDRDQLEGEVVIPETEGGALGFEESGVNGGEPRERRVNGF